MQKFGQDSSVNPWLPGHTVSSSGPLSYTIHLPDGRTFRGHIDHICKCTKSHSELDHEQVTASEFTEVVDSCQLLPLHACSNLFTCEIFHNAHSFN